MTKRPVHRRIRPLLMMIAVLLVLGWSATAAFILADPLDLYSWGVHPILKHEQYSMDATPYLVDVVAKNPDIDTLFVGGSTGHQFTDAMMEQILPGTHRAFNLSHTAPRPPDRELTQDKILEYSHARRVIIELDWRYQLPKAVERRVDVTGNDFPLFLYDDTAWNDVRGVGFKTMRLTAGVLAGGPVWLPEWSDEKWRRQDARDYKNFVSPQSMAKLRAIIARHKHDIDVPTTYNCGDLDVIGGDLVPFARALSRRGVELDVIFPVYSPAVVYEWVDGLDRLRVNGPSFMNDQLVMRRCAVAALDGIAHVRIFGFDDVPGLADNLANFRDPGHLYNEAAARYMLRSMARDEHRLTRANVGEKTEAMRRRIVNYQVVIGPPWQAPK